uniref:Serine/threonine protein phosphatase 2A 57 kDa regulatory subunit B' beta isoform-like n=1 Tax=Rhizophora mucronata TaxID=61149 RepID=A0A2P2NRE7_RHIMU
MGDDGNAHPHFGAILFFVFFVSLSFKFFLISLRSLIY